MMGLIDLEQLKQGYDKKKSGVNGEKSGSSRPQIGLKSGGCRDSKNGCKPSNGKALETIEEDDPKKELIRIKNSSTSNDGQEVQVSRAQGGAGATHSHSPALVTQGAE